MSPELERLLEAYYEKRTCPGRRERNELLLSDDCLPKRYRENLV